MESQAGVQLIIAAGADACCIYGKKIPLNELGSISIRRASHVEPTPDGRWMADLSPVCGPVLGQFACRSDALQAELVWLSTHWLEVAIDVRRRSI